MSLAPNVYTCLMLAEKRPVRVSIYNQPLTLLAADPAEAETLANRVDDLNRKIAAHAGNVDTTRAAMLACRVGQSPSRRSVRPTDPRKSTSPP